MCIEDRAKNGVQGERNNSVLSFNIECGYGVSHPGAGLEVEVGAIKDGCKLGQRRGNLLLANVLLFGIVEILVALADVGAGSCVTVVTK